MNRFKLAYKALVGKSESQLSDDNWDKVYDDDGKGSANNMARLKVITKARSLKNEKAARYADYSRMLNDVIIGSAVQLVADDSTKFSVERDRTVWIEGGKKTRCNEFNQFLKKAVEPFINEIAFDIASKGEFVYKINIVKDKVKSTGAESSESEVSRMVLVPFTDTQKFFQLVLADGSHHFVIIGDEKRLREEKLALESYDDYVHFINYSIRNSSIVDVSAKGVSDSQKAFILSSQSVQLERIRQIAKIIEIIENAIISTRIAKSNFLRVVNVEVPEGNEVKAKKIVDHIEGLVNKNIAMAAKQNLSVDYIATEFNTVVLPHTANGKGKIEVNDYYPNVDIKDVYDLDFFMNKLFAGLHTPKSYLNFSDDGYPGINNEKSLSKIDIRYSRLCQRVQKTYKSGVERLAEIFWQMNGWDDIEKYRVRVPHIQTSEDEDLAFSSEQKLQIGTQMVGAISSEDGSLDLPKLELLVRFFRDAVPFPDLADFLENLRDDPNIT